MAESEADQLVAVDGKCPFNYYESARLRGQVEFEADTGMWVAATHASVVKVLTDEDAFPRPLAEQIVSDSKYVRTVATPFFLTGDDRLRHHKWWLDVFSPANLRSYRTGIVLDVVEAMIDRFSELGKADMVRDFAEPLADRVIAAVLGLPWQDDAWIAELRANFDKMEHYKASIYLKPSVAEPLAEAALDATYRIDDLMRPYVDQRKTRPDDTVMSRALHDEAMEGWDDEAVYGLLRTFFTGGSGTTSIQVVNAIYLMLTTDGISSAIAGGDEKLVARFVEEALRLLPTNHFRVRHVADDLEFEGATLRKGDTMAALIAAGNRDPQRYAEPDEVDLARPNARQHLTFSVGVGACVGSGLARLVLQVALERLVARLPGLRLDPEAGEPDLGGSMFRQMSPVSVLFDSQPTTGPASSA